MSDVTERITTYLINGGAFNPELADHSAVRNLLIDARAELDALRALLKEAREWLVPISPTGEKAIERIDSALDKGAGDE